MNQELSLDQLLEAAEAFGRSLPSGSVVFLEGDLGAGKTTAVNAICRGLGVSQRATSPTFALVHRYDGARGPVYHVDCYRLRSPAESRDLDWEGMLAEGDALLVEWPEHAGEWAPKPSHRVTLEHVAAPDLRLVRGF